MNYLLTQTNNWTYLLLVDLIFAEALVGKHEISLFGGILVHLCRIQLHEAALWHIDSAECDAM